MSDQIEHTPRATSIVSVDDVAVGALLVGKYRIVRVLGQGGMGVVVEAEHARLGERVAIKFLSHQHQGGESRERFEREARASVRMRSEHVARVRDIGELDTGQPYIVMELLQGQDLGRYVEGVVLDTTSIVDLALQCCEALAEAHALGIVHRDIKPPNLFITHDGERRILKLLDFGVATAPIDDLQITGTGVIVGTPSYMCPEQMRSSRAAEPHWDLWSLGIVLYEMFERALPFSCDSFAELAVAVLTQPPRPMTNTPPALRPILARCLAKQAANRYLEAAELAEALAPFATPEQVARTRRRIARTAGVPVSLERRHLSGPTVVTAAVGTPPPAPSTPPAGRAMPPSLEVPARRRGPTVVLGVLFVAAVAAMVAIALRPDKVEPAPTPASTVTSDAAPDAPPDAPPTEVDVPPADASADAPADAPEARPPPIDARPIHRSKPALAPDAAAAPVAPPDALTPEQLMKGRS